MNYNSNVKIEFPVEIWDNVFGFLDNDEKLKVLLLCRWAYEVSKWSSHYNVIRIKRLTSIKLTEKELKGISNHTNQILLTKKHLIFNDSFICNIKNHPKHDILKRMFNSVIISEKTLPMRVIILNNTFYI